MGNIATNVCAKFGYDRLCINKAIGIFLQVITATKIRCKRTMSLQLGSIPDPECNNYITCFWRTVL